MSVTSKRSRYAAIALATLILGAGLLPLLRAAEPEKPAADPALERTRKQVRMLDDLYKTAIVLVTTHYVEEDSDLAAGDAFQALFKTMKDNGWHEVRLLDATGSPYDEANTPKEGFEKTAVSKLKGGEKWYDEVLEKDGKKYLQAATPIPVVMKKCVMCHDNYADLPEGTIIGSLSYTIPIE